MLIAGTAVAQSVSLSDLRGTYVFRGQAVDWTGYGLCPPTISTLNVSVNEADNTVSMTGFLGADVAVWIGDADEAVFDALHGVYDPETQVITFEDCDTSESFFTLHDDYYDWYLYNLCLQAARDEQGNVVLNMVPNAADRLCVIQTYYYDYDTNQYVYPNYGYDEGGQAIQLSAQATSAIGELVAGEYDLCYTTYSRAEDKTLAVVSTDADGLLSLTVGKGVVGLNAQTSGRGTNKYTYAYVSEGCWYTQNLYWFGDGEYDYSSYICPEYWGQSEVTLYFNGDGSMSLNTGLWLGSEEGGVTAYNPVLRPRNEQSISTINADNAAAYSYDLMGRRTVSNRGMMIRNGKVMMRL